MRAFYDASPKGSRSGKDTARSFRSDVMASAAMEGFPQKESPASGASLSLMSAWEC
jgi:hypothetical protein